MTLDPIHQFKSKTSSDRPDRRSHDRVHQFLSLHAAHGGGDLPADGSRHKGRQVVPGRFQSMAELSYEFVANMIRSTAGEDGMKFFPLVYSLFMFILVSNVIGIIPYTFTVSSHIIVTAAFALLVFFTVLVYGFYKNGLKFFKIFVPPGIPIYILPLVVAIEIISFLSRPLSHSVRLFANMLAGHITLKVFAGLRRPAGYLARCNRLDRRHRAAGHDRCADRARTAGRVPSGLCVCDPDLHLPQRRPSPGTLV